MRKIYAIVFVCVLFALLSCAPSKNVTKDPVIVEQPKFKEYKIVYSFDQKEFNRIIENNQEEFEYQMLVFKTQDDYPGCILNPSYSMGYNKEEDSVLIIFYCKEELE